MKKAKIDNLGRIVIPKPFRKELNLESGSTVIVTLEHNSIVICEEHVCCKRCGAIVESANEFPLCEACIETIKQIYL